MKKLVISSLLIIIGTCVIAQDKILCLKCNKPIGYDVDSVNSEFFVVNIEDDLCSSTLFDIPSQFYHESDSIIIKIKKGHLTDSNGNIKASYCYSVGMHNIALYLDPNLFGVSTCEGNNLSYSIELFFSDEKKYRKIINHSSLREN